MKKEQKSVKQLRREKMEREARERAKEVQSSEQAAAKTKLFSPTSIVLISGALILVIVFGVVAGILLKIAQNPYRHDDTPVVVITFEDGFNKRYELVFELYYDQAPIAVTVFHYFASKGYYNGTIIDTIAPASTNDSLKMGGYTYSRVISGVRPKMFEANSSYNDPKFTFYAREDSTATLGDPNEVGALSTIKFPYGPSAEFQIGASQGTKGSGASDGRVFGRAYDEETIALLRQFAKIDKVQPENVLASSAPSGIVKIVKMKFYNNEELLNHVDFNDEFRNAYLNGTTREYSDRLV